MRARFRSHRWPDNPLQTAVLNLFVSLKSRYPNLVVGAITRDSVKKALANGITADQVRDAPVMDLGIMILTLFLNRSSATSRPTRTPK